MERAAVFIFVFTVVESAIVKTYNYIDTKTEWDEAQEYCREHHTDLAFADNQQDYDEILSLGGDKGWLGLFRDADNKTRWRWSGGGYITFEHWKHDRPKEGGDETVGLLEHGHWLDKKPSEEKEFYCVTLTIMDHMKMPWEEALDYCRRNNTDLGSRLSPTMLHLTRRLLKQRNADRVWIGLRYLDNHWLWVNGHAPERQAWSAGADQDQQCPLTKRCGSLTMDGRWEPWDCQESLYFFCK